MDAHARLYYMDNLRALAMLAGVLFHAALAYSPLARPFFPTADRSGADVVDVFAWFLHLWRMPLFFLVAGFFTAHLVQRRGVAGMFRNRLLRVGVVFLLAWPLVHWALSASTLHAAATAVHPSPLLLLVRDYMQATDLPRHAPGTSHLWFLYYLLLFYVLTWAGRTLGLGAWWARLGALHPAWALGVLPLLLVPALVSVSAPHPAPEGLLPQFWAVWFFGAFFASGYLLHSRPGLAVRPRSVTLSLLLGSALLYAALLVRLQAQPALPPGTGTAWTTAGLEAFISVWMSWVCLELGRTLLDLRHRVLRYLADASYWIYIVHLPVLFAIQYELMDFDWHWSGKFVLSVLLTLAACLLSYHVLVRPTPLGRVLGARRAVPVVAPG